MTSSERRGAALKALDEVGRTAVGARLDATKAVRSATGCDLATALAAVEWAMARPPAASLPSESVVTTVGGAFFKEEDSSDSGYPWAATHVNRQISDADIDELLRADRATVLRVGTGAP